MTRRVSLTAIYEPVEEGWIQARIEELPGVVTVAPTLEEAKEMLLDALHEYLLALGSRDQREQGPTLGHREKLVLDLVA